MARPSDWYDLSYSQQREWEDNEKRHQRELEDREYERDRERRQYEADVERASDDIRRSRARLRELNAELEDADNEAGECRRKVASLEAFLAAQHLTDVYQAWADARVTAIGTEEE